MKTFGGIFAKIKRTKRIPALAGMTLFRCGPSKEIFFIGSIILSFVFIATTFSQPNYYLLRVEKVDGDAVLAFRTFDFFPCFGSSIRVSQMWVGDTAVVSVLGFVKPNPCIGGAAPAESRVLVERHGSNDFYLKIIDDGVADLWHITFIENSFNGTPVKNSFTTYH
ncbi:MAG: hypothetical protein KGJ59_11135 [Bacteroidota bacterium]|nr:hypothetical protein [Bacteroidota bacterium]